MAEAVALGESARGSSAPNPNVGCVIVASSGRDVILTVVAGSEVYRNGRVSNVDEDRLRARMSEINLRLHG